MNNKKEIMKQKIWKHFWKQKMEEIVYFLFVVFILLGIASVLSGFVFLVNLSMVAEEQFNYPSWLAISTFMIWAFWIIVGFKCWIESNWEEAKENAKEEYARENRRKK